MIKVTVGGATGRLGKAVCGIIASSDDMELVGAVVSDGGGNVGREIVPGLKAVGPDSAEEFIRKCDVYVDLTSPDAAAKLIADVPSWGANLILGTTAVPADVLAALAANVSKFGTSAVSSANFAIGVNVFWKTCADMAAALPGYDIEIIEIHHGAKKDAPSGTAAETLRRLQEASGIADAVYGRQGVSGPRGREIGVHAVRAGDVIGDHTVIFAKNMERLELTHRAVSREAFAEGCAASIRWVCGRKDGKVHSMEEVLGL
ncbi:MAG: 4-hydroxy-tetrahydrodipicolinate reductase [Candidatus Methanoplasma sp.]|jgi:4-hydroxy-tetrahydrodipicolinate reductase|nr:4-hydroxy-tetrahydrodipicolinate reductase [Candidatus Methanoplasma sp.]